MPVDHLHKTKLWPPVNDRVGATVRLIRTISVTFFSGCFLLFGLAAVAEEPSPAGIEFFEKKVRPVLVNRCFECHGDDSQSDLRLDSLAGMLRGGTRGPALVVGKPDESLLISALRHGEILKMPSKTKLPQAEINDIIRWVEIGAPWPGAGPVPVQEEEAQSASGEKQYSDVQRSFWSLQPPVATDVPSVEDPDWTRAPTDAFVLARLESAQLNPAPAADRRTLLRRATFDLTGLPPSPRAIREFLADETPDAFSKVLDRLLSSPHYGERWGRHWLDVARYADSNGLDENLAYGNAYHYRDYVISALNRDKPFDRFIQEQLAGDLLPCEGDDAIEATVATGFLSLGAKMLAEDDPMKMQMDIIDEQIDTIGRAFMGLTLGCARCHDHKFDPISSRDYYALAGIFKSTKTMEHFTVVAQWQEKPLAAAAAIEARDKLQQQLDAQQAEIDKVATSATEAVLGQARSHVGQYLLAARELNRHTLFGNQPDIGSRPDAILIEAEDYARGNVNKDHTHYGKGIGVLVSRGELPNFAEYDIDLPEDGRYHIEIRVAAADARPCALSINGLLLKSDAAGEVTGSWFSDTQAWSYEGVCRLTAGKCVVRLENPQAFPHIDKLLLVKSPPPAAELSTIAEWADNDYEPIQEFVEQWSVYLQKSSDDGDAPFADWLAASGPDDLAALASLARQYQQRGAAISTTAGDPVPESSADPKDEGLRKVLYDAKGPFQVPETIERHFAAESVEQLAVLRQAKQTLADSLPQFPQAMAVSSGSAEDLQVHIRGSHLTLGETVPRGFPVVLRSGVETSIDSDQSGRLELAHWMTSAEHPLTSRVIVNRVWLWHFGAGLVRSPDNFGQLGERPTHPELLDWLAQQFAADGWSIKGLHREIMLSSTYRMSTAFNEQAAAADPENRLRWRFERRRLEAEAIRDSLLVAGGQLDDQMGGSLLPTENRNYVTSTANVDPVAYQSNRRAVYLPVVRSAVYDVFQAFDFADPSMLSGQRQSTTVAPQALFMMNSQLVADQTAALADYLLAQPDVQDAERVQAIYERAFARLPSEAEVARALDFVQRYSEMAATSDVGGDETKRDETKRDETKHDEARRRVWQSLCRVVLSTNEFIYLD